MIASDFTKNKVHFTIALLAVIFALHPFFPTFDKINFVYMGRPIPLSDALMGVGVLLALAVYFYATDLMTEHPSPLSQRLGNFFYALAVMTLPFYGGLHLSTLLEDYLIDEGFFEEHGIKTPVITVIILVVWVTVWVACSMLLRRYLSQRDWVSKIDALADQEMNCLRRAEELAEAEHPDLAIIQFHKAIEMRLKMAGMKRGFMDGDVFLNAKKANLLTPGNQFQLDIVRRHYVKAQSHVPASPDDLAQTVGAAKKFLATVPV